jgi:bacterioferritin-associated ferredoxin
MIVCMCNRITDVKVRAAVTAGARTPKDVFKKLGTPRGCGQCLETMETVLAEVRTEKKTA